MLKISASCLLKEGITELYLSGWPGVYEVQSKRNGDLLLLEAWARANGETWSFDEAPGGILHCRSSLAGKPKASITRMPGENGYPLVLHLFVPRARLTSLRLHIS
mgnify:CR=1 FL=1